MLYFSYHLTVDDWHYCHMLDIRFKDLKDLTHTMLAQHGIDKCSLTDSKCQENSHTMHYTKHSHADKYNWCAVQASGSNVMLTQNDSCRRIHCAKQRILQYMSNITFIFYKRVAFCLHILIIYI